MQRPVMDSIGRKVTVPSPGVIVVLDGIARIVDRQSVVLVMDRYGHWNE
jgi:hypothetical protein